MKLVDKPYKIRVHTENNIIELSDINSQKEGVYVGYNNGKITLKAEVKLKSLEIVWKYKFIDNTKILNDAFERSYADLKWADADKSGKLYWYFAAENKDGVDCFGVKTQPNAFCHFRYNNGEITLFADIRSGSVAVDINGRELEVCEVVSRHYEYEPFEALREFCTVMCQNPRGVKGKMIGGNDWYCNYGNSSAEKILEHTKRIAECAKDCDTKPYMVIDDGWQMCVYPEFNGGPWRYSCDKFGDMSKLVKDMENIGVIPGIWLRPLLTCERVDDKCVYNHPQNIHTFLDPTDEYVLGYVKKSIETIKEWGFKLIKHDFTTYDITGKWGFEMEDDIMADNMKFSIDTLTTAEVIKNLYTTIRQAAGDDMVIIGCNTISHLSAGFFEVQRIGDDTSGREWERTCSMGVNTLAFRMAQHKTFYDIDADCVGIMADEKGHFLIPWEKNKKWLDLLAKSGTPLFVSIGDNCFTNEVKEALKKAFKTACESQGIKPVDWDSQRFPNKWEANNQIIEYDWDYDPEKMTEFLMPY